jgi:hypothetical protein
LAYAAFAGACPTLCSGDDSPRAVNGGFIEEASKLFTDALTHELGDPSKFVALYALIAKLRLFASPRVIASAEQVMRRIVETYNLPNRDYRKPVEVEEQPEQDLLRGFSEACRADLHV